MEIGVDTPQEPDSAIPKVAVRPPFDAVELGTTLRETRIALGHDLGEVANDLRIRNIYLQAIEEGRLGDLPGNAYATGFLRAYGDYLGLDGGDIVARYKASGGPTAGQTDLHLPSPVEEGRLPTASVLVLAALLAVCAYGGWYYMASTGDNPAEQVPALPDKIAALVPKDGPPAPAAASGPERTVIGSDPTAAPAGAGATEATPATAEAPEPAADEGSAADGAGEAATATAPAEEPAVAAAPAAPAPAPVPANSAAPPAPATAAVTPPPPPQVQARLPAAESSPAPVPVPVPAPAPVPEMAREATSPADGDATPKPTALVEPPASDTESPAPAERPSAASVRSRIMLRASTDSWVEVRGDGADPLYSGLLRQGDTYKVPEQPGLTLITGNAGGIEILVDGKAIPRLGPPGAVRRDVVLDADALLHHTQQ